MELPKYKRVNAIPANVDNTIVFVKGTATNEVSVHYEDQGTDFPIQGDDGLDGLLNDRHTFIWTQSMWAWNNTKRHVKDPCLVWVDAVGGNGRLYFYDPDMNTMSLLKESVT